MFSAIKFNTKTLFFIVPLDYIIKICYNQYIKIQKYLYKSSKERMNNQKLKVNKNSPVYTEAPIFKRNARYVYGFIEYNFSAPMHKQEFYEINVILSGSAKHFVDEYEYTVEKGDCFIIPPEVWHGYIGGEGFNVYHILLSTQYMQKHAADLNLLPAFSALFKVDPLMQKKYSNKLKFNLSDAEFETLTPLFDNLFKHSHSNNTGESLLIAGSEALIIITMLCEIYKSRFLSDNSAKEDEAFLESVAYIYKNFNKVITIETLHKIACMSRTAYLKEFKRITGMTPAQLQTAHKIQTAKSLLCYSNLNLSEIASETGFYDISHFTRVFLKEVGKSPATYRKQTQTI